MMRIGRVEDESLKVQFPQAPNARPRLKIHICEVADAIRTLKKSRFWVEIQPDLPMLVERLKPVRVVIESGARVVLPRRKSWSAALRSERIDHEIAKEDQPRIRPGGLVEAVGRVSGAFVDQHAANVRTAPQRTFEAR